MEKNVFTFYKKISVRVQKRLRQYINIANLNKNIIFMKKFTKFKALQKLILIFIFKSFEID